jgi:glutathione S-transferase
MTIRLYDLAGANPALRFSPYCFRTKLALLHKGLDFETVPWRFTDKSRIAETGQERVPVIVDGKRWVNDSWSIALYLDETYPARPKLFPDAQSRNYARFLNSWCDWSVNPAIRPLAVRHVFDAIDEKDKAYFRESREKQLGMKIEAIGADQVAAAAGFASALKPAEIMLADHRFLHGAEPGYGDYALFGSLLWPFAVCPKDPIDYVSNVGKWFERMMGRFDSWAARQPTVRSLA